MGILCPKKLKKMKTLVSNIKKVRVEDLVVSEITKRIYDYSNRQSEIRSLEQSIKEIGQREPIIVIPNGIKYLIIDGVLRFYSIKNLNLNLNEIDVIVVDFEPTEEFTLTDFIIHHQIRKEKTSSEKLNEVREVLRIDRKKKNPLRNKESRVKLVSDMMGGKGWGRNNVFNLETIMKWEMNSGHKLEMSEKVVSNELKIKRAQDVIKLIKDNDFKVNEEKESLILKGFIEGKYEKDYAQNLITVYRIKKSDKPTSIGFQPVRNENFEIILGNAEDVVLPESHRYDAIFTSPPYYKLRKYGDDPNELGWEETPDLYVQRLANILMKGYDRLKDTGSMFINIGETYDDIRCLAVIERLTLELINRGARFIDKLIWEKRANKPMSNTNKRLKNTYEVVLHFAKTKDYYFERFKINQEKKLQVSKGCKEHFYNKDSFHIPNKFTSPHNMLGDDYVDNILRIQLNKDRTKHAEGESIHPATFPTTLPLIPLLISCPKDKNTLVFDPFAGTSSSGVTALRLGFKYVGVELYPENVETANRILAEAKEKYDGTSVNDVLDGLGMIRFDDIEPIDMAA